MILAAKAATGAASISRWIIGGASGGLQTSDDAIPTTWTSRTSGFGANQIWSIASSGQIFVAVGAAGVLTTSTDAITWTARTSSFGTTVIRSVAYGNGIWVAVGESGKIATATDPTGTWTQRTSGVATSLCGIAYGAGIWVTIDTAGAVRTATDPTGTWTARTSNIGTINTVSRNAVKWCPTQGVFVIGNDGTAPEIATSADGITWTGRNLATDDQNGAGMVATSNASVIAVGFQTTTVTVFDINTSTTGATWTDRTPASTTAFYGAATSPSGLMVIVGWASVSTFTTQSSQDGTTWTARAAHAVSTPYALCHTQGFAG